MSNIWKFKPVLTKAPAAPASASGLEPAIKELKLDASSRPRPKATAGKQKVTGRVAFPFAQRLFHDALRRLHCNKKETARSHVPGPAEPGGKFILVKNDAHAFIGKPYRIGRLAVRPARKDKFDDTLPADRPDGVANTICRQACFTPGLLCGFFGDGQWFLDFSSTTLNKLPHRIMFMPQEDQRICAQANTDTLSIGKRCKRSRTPATCPSGLLPFIFNSFNKDY